MPTTFVHFTAGVEMDDDNTGAPPCSDSRTPILFHEGETDTCLVFGENEEDIRQKHEWFHQIAAQPADK